MIEAHHIDHYAPVLVPILQTHPIMRPVKLKSETQLDFQSLKMLRRRPPWNSAPLSNESANISAKAKGCDKYEGRAAIGDFAVRRGGLTA